MASLILWYLILTHHLESCIQIWSPQHRKDMDLFERVQRKAMKMITVVEHVSCVERLSELGFFSLEKAPGQPYCSLSATKGGLQESWRGTFYKDM